MADTITRLNAALDGRYRIERELGRGGMATVYLANDAKHERGVALKVFRPELSAMLGAERFINEIRITANLQHPHILPLFDSGISDSLLYYVMPHVDGETLAQKLERDGALDIDEALAIGRSVAAALHYAHRQGVVHRDIKPENVMLSDGLPVVADFGIAAALDAAATNGDRLTRTGLSVGTPGYMSPEQAAGDPIDARSDVYALGCLIFEMLTGRAPYDGTSAQAVLTKVFTEPVPSVRTYRDGIPDTVEAALQRALAKDADDRFPTAAEMATSLMGGSSEKIEMREALAIAPAKRTPFVGREAEREQLLAALDEAVRGHGSMVLIGGEPGVGKTRLAEEILLEAQRRELLCFIGHCYEGEGSAPYTPFVETLEYAVRAVPEEIFRATLGDSAPEVARIMPKLRRIFPDIPPAIDLPPEQQRRYLFNSYREFVERGTQVNPLIVLLDDLHWADEPSLLLLEHLAQHVPTQRVLMIGTYRDVELEVTRPFAKTLSNLTRQRLAQRLTIRRLSQDSVGDLLAALGGPGPPASLAASIYRETEGNPFFVEEVFRDLAEDGKLFDESGAWLSDLDVAGLEVPEGVRLVIGRRLERVGDDVQKILTAGGVIGRRFSLSVLEALELVDEDNLFDALEAAEDAQLIHATAEGRETVYKFSHELIRQTLVGRLSIPRRQRLHLKISAAMESVFEGTLEDRAADYSYHLYQAGTAADPDKTIHFLSLAGDQALAAAAFEETLDHTELALSVLEDPSAKQLGDLLAKKGWAQRGMGRWSSALGTWEKALPLLEEAGEQKAAANLCHAQSVMYGWMGRLEEWRDVNDRGLGLVGDEPSRLRAHLLAARGAIEAMAFDQPVGLEMFDQAVEMAESLDDPHALGHALQIGSIMHWNLGDPYTHLRMAERGSEVLRSTGDAWHLVQLLGHMMLGHATLGRLDRARRLQPEILSIGAELGHVGALMQVDWLRAIEDLFKGALPRSRATFDKSVEDWEAVRPWNLSGASWGSMVSFLLGDWDRALERARYSNREFPDGNFWTGAYQWAEALITAYADRDAAPDLLEETAASLPTPGQPTVGGSRVLALGTCEASAILGRRDAAAELYDVCREVREKGILVWIGLTERLLGISAACGEEWDAAEEHFRTALTQATEWPVRHEQGEVRRWHARMLLDRGAQGDRERARELLAEAIGVYEELGMPRHVDLAKEMA